MNVFRRAYKRVTPLVVRESLYPYALSALRLSAHLDWTVIAMRKRLRQLKGSCEGQRCFIMGNGPSLNQMDLSLFAGESVWGSNRCYLLFDRIDWRPNFYVAVDTRVVPDIGEELLSVRQQLPGTKFFFPHAFRLGGALASTRNTYWYNRVPLDEEKLPFGMFSADVVARVSDVRTVTIAALQLAVHCGFDPIYLIGCDTSYTVPASVQADASSRNGLVSTQNDDPNHFDSSYFGKGSKWHIPYPERMIHHYAQAKTACDQLGVSVYNATVGGKLEVFPRVDYRDLF